MQRRPKEMTTAAMAQATQYAQYRVQQVLQQAKAIQADAQKTVRLTQHLCKACFYKEPSVSGAAMTHQPCMCCGENQLYASTKTDALCAQCATTHSLCKHCGGDIDMNTGRSSWPTPSEGLEP